MTHLLVHNIVNPSSPTQSPYPFDSTTGRRREKSTETAGYFCQTQGQAPSAPQQRQQQQKQAQLQSGPSGILYDMSSFDPLQQQALQLTASAGLTAGLLAGQQQAAGAATAGSNHNRNAGSQQKQQASVPAQPQQQLFLFQQHQQAAAAAAAATASSSGTLSSAAPIVQSQQPTVQPLLAPTGVNAQALLLPALVSQFPQHLLVAQGLVPQQYLDAANGAAVPGVATPNQAGSQHQPQHQPLVPLAAASAPNSSRRGMHGANGAPNKKLKKHHLAPSIVSSSTNTSTTGLAANAALISSLAGAASSVPASSAFAFPGSDPPAPKEASASDLSKMTPAERRRYERNLREQQRSYRISQQIKELRDILVDSKFPFKPNKYSILLSVVDYIKQLQSRAIMLDTEHSKLIKTIRETNSMVNTGNLPTSTDGESETVNAASTTESGSDTEMLFVKGIDYQSVFDQCPAALGIAALDGRILECNAEFQTLLGFSQREDVLKQSLFNLVHNHQDIFRAMAQMLKTAEEPSSSLLSESGGPNRIPNTDGDGACPPSTVTATENNSAEAAPVKSVAISQDRFWTGPVTSKLNVKVSELPLGVIGGIYLWQIPTYHSSPLYSY
ncbi:MAG: hypothetical protein SGILL_000728 [Bacillariaceae sp.]